MNTACQVDCSLRFYFADGDQEPAADLLAEIEELLGPVLGRIRAEFAVTGVSMKVNYEQRGKL